MSVTIQKAFDEHIRRNGGEISQRDLFAAGWSAGYSEGVKRGKEEEQLRRAIGWSNAPCPNCKEPGEGK